MIPGISNLFAPLAMKVAGGIIAVLVLVIVILAWQLDAANERTAKRAAQFAVCEQSHATTRASLKELEAEMAHIVADGARREQRLAEAAREQAKRSEVIQNEVTRIVERTPQPKEAPPCRTPDDILSSGAL